MFYAADNRYGSSTSIGFANTWRVLAFADRKSRDHWVEDNRHDMSVRTIKRADIGKYLEDVKPFSGEAVCIDSNLDYMDAEGLVGLVCVAFPSRYDGVTKLRA